MFQTLRGWTRHLHHNTKYRMQLRDKCDNSNTNVIGRYHQKCIKTKLTALLSIKLTKTSTNLQF